MIDKTIYTEVARKFLFVGRIDSGYLSLHGLSNLNAENTNASSSPIYKDTFTWLYSGLTQKMKGVQASKWRCGSFLEA